METVNATDLKHRLGSVLDLATLKEVAITRHGRVVAYLVPAKSRERGARRKTSGTAPPGLGRAQEERLLKLCASGDLRPSRWRRAGDPEVLAGVAVMLASTDLFDRRRLLALAESLHPGMTNPEVFAEWLEHAPVKGARLVPLLEAELRHRKSQETR